MLNQSRVVFEGPSAIQIHRVGIDTPDTANIPLTVCVRVGKKDGDFYGDYTNHNNGKFYFLNSEHSGVTINGKGSAVIFFSGTLEAINKALAQGLAYEVPGNSHETCTFTVDTFDHATGRPLPENFINILQHPLPPLPGTGYMEYVCSESVHAATEITGHIVPQGESSTTHFLELDPNQFHVVQNNHLHLNEIAPNLHYIGQQQFSEMHDSSANYVRMVQKDGDVRLQIHLADGSQDMEMRFDAHNPLAEGHFLRFENLEGVQMDASLVYDLSTFSGSDHVHIDQSKAISDMHFDFTGSQLQLFNIAGTGFDSITGGSGYNTLSVKGDVTLDQAAFDRVASGLQKIDEINLSESHATLSIDAQSLNHMAPTDASSGFREHTLFISGDQHSTVHLVADQGHSWALTFSNAVYYGHVYDRYTNGTANLYIQHEINKDIQR